MKPIWLGEHIDEAGFKTLTLPGSSYQNLGHNWNCLLTALDETVLQRNHYAGCIARHNDHE